MPQTNFERDVCILLNTIHKNLLEISELIALQHSDPDIRRMAERFAPSILPAIKTSPKSSSILQGESDGS